jgi:hypothetical protein
LGVEIVNLAASLVFNFTHGVSDQFFFNHPSISVKDVDYCNITATYTHPGQNDTINVESLVIEEQCGNPYYASKVFRLVCNNSTTSLSLQSYHQLQQTLT